MVRQNSLRGIRHSRGSAIMEIAVLSGVSTTTIVGIEKYGYYPGSTVRERISKVLEVPENVVWPEVAEVVRDGK